MSEAVSTPMALPKPVPLAPVSWEEFLAWCDPEIHAEWVDGVIQVNSPNSLPHQRIVRFLATVMQEFVEAHELGEILDQSYLMRLPNRPSGREPDILFVPTDRANQLTETYLDGPAALVVEVVSTESDARDHGEKFVEYEAAAIQEYWLIDPLRAAATFFQLGEDGRYHQAEVSAEGVYRSRDLPGFWLRVQWLWERPRLAEVRRELGL